MEPIYYKLKACKKEPNARLDGCKVLGSPVFPENFLEKHPLSEDDYFVAQVNLSELPKRPGIPNEGWLYFFVNVETLKPTVFYTKEEPAELVDNINESFDEDYYGTTICHYMEFNEESEAFLFGDNCPDLDLGMYLKDEDEKFTLLQIDALGFPKKSRILRLGNLATNDGYFIFVMPKKDLAKLNFKNVELIDYGS